MLDSIFNLPQIGSETCIGLKTFHDTIHECLLGVRNLKVKTENWDTPLTYLLIKKLDKETRKHYECQLQNPRVLQKIDDLLKYVESRFMALEAYEPRMNDTNNNKKESIRKSERHLTKNSRTNIKCKSCDRGHNTLIHVNEFAIKKPADGNFDANKNKNIASNNMPSTSKSFNITTPYCMNTILATAMVKIKNNMGEPILFKALIDQGSQSSFISENAAQLLGIPREKINATITDIGEQEKTAKSTISIQVQPRMASDFILQTNTVVLNKLTMCPDLSNADETNWTHLNNLTLADLWSSHR